MSQDLKKIFRQINKQSEELAISAMNNAAQKAYRLMLEKKNECLQTYYKRKPKIYKRTNSLRNAIKYMHPTFKEQGENCSIEFGLAYNSKWIDGVYQSSSWYHENGKNWVSRYDNPDDFNYNSQSNGVPDSSWILDNYLKGIHPGWYVDKNGNRTNHGWEDGEQNSTEYMMTQFFEKELFEKAGELIYESMRDAVLDFIKTNGGGK